MWCPSCSVITGSQKKPVSVDKSKQNIGKERTRMSRPRHPNKDIEAAVVYAESMGWRYVKAGKSAHVWCRMYCEFADREGCRVSVNSTPKSSHDHAAMIRKVVDACTHRAEKEGG